jgi:hypothetical protein
LIQSILRLGTAKNLDGAQSSPPLFWGSWLSGLEVENFVVTELSGIEGLLRSPELWANVCYALLHFLVAQIYQRFYESAASAPIQIFLGVGRV